MHRIEFMNHPRRIQRLTIYNTYSSPSERAWETIQYNENHSSRIGERSALLNGCPSCLCQSALVPIVQFYMTRKHAFTFSPRGERQTQLKHRGRSTGFGQPKRKKNMESPNNIEDWLLTNYRTVLIKSLFQINSVLQADVFLKYMVVSS